MKNMKIWILLAALAIIAVPSFGQNYQLQREITAEDGGGGGWYDVAYADSGQYVDNPCTATADWVLVSYSMYVEGEQFMAGVDRYQFDESTTISGTYSGSGSSSSDVAYAQPVEMRYYTKMNNVDNFHVITVVSFDPASQTTTLSLDSACGNGMPDSL